MRPTLWCAFLLPLLLACEEVAEVLTAAQAAGGSADTNGANAGVPSAAGVGGGKSDGGVGGGAAGTEAQAGMPPDLTLGTSLSAGQSHNCLARHGLVYCWGNNGAGQLGLGDFENRVAPTAVPSARAVVQVTAAEFHTCWLDVEGTVSCFGSNADGQLGRNDVTESLVPATVTLPAPASAVDANYSHTCAILVSGELYCWGENLETQLGQADEPDTNRFEPTLVGQVDEPVAVGCGQGHTVAIDAHQNVVTWGRNSTGEAGLGDGLPVRIREPTAISSATGFVAVEVGQSSACAIQQGGSLFCWGAGNEQHLGTFSDATVWQPTQVAVEQTWLQVSTDTFHTCGINDAEHLFCWGRGLEGQLGLGNYDPATPAATDVGGGPWKTVSAGRFHTCALDSAEHVWCTGLNGRGQLGNGATSKENVFVEALLPP